jgi:hypothetical protein
VSSSVLVIIASIWSSVIVRGRQAAVIRHAL